MEKDDLGRYIVEIKRVRLRLQSSKSTTRSSLPSRVLWALIFN